jgi:hypothetical protein
VTIRDNLGNPVGSYTVTGNFTGDGGQTGVTGAATTNSSGATTLTSTNSKKGRVKFAFCVTGISGVLGYDPGPDGEDCASN